jgi:prepilin-type N-terminal cleavage/methylation domain-containing protein
MGKGFGIVELLVVIAIVAIITIAGVVQYSAYKRRANDIVAVADIMAIAKDLHKDFAQHGSYSADDLPLVQTSEGVEYSIEITGEEKEDFVAHTWHRRGTKTWCYEPGGSGRELGRSGLSSIDQLGYSCISKSKLER